MVCEGEVHFALASGPHLSCRDVEFRKFMRDDVVLIAPLDHPWASRGEIDPEELVEADFIFREEGSGTQTAVQQALASVNIDVSQLETILILGNSEAIALAVQEGLGLGFVSNFIVTRLVAGHVAPVKLRGLEIYRDIYIASHTRRPPTMAQAAFWDLIINQDDQLFSGTLLEQEMVIA
jgi:DNA-binding transcriptional LysR family regulator